MFEFIGTLSESRLIPSKSNYRHFGADELAELAVLYVSALNILFFVKETKQFAISYARQTVANGTNFTKWQTGANDLYAILYGLEGKDVELDDPEFSNDFKHTLPFGGPALVQWLKDMAGGHHVPAHHRPLFTRLDFNFKIKNSSIKAVRRLAMDWPDLDGHERQLVMTRLLQLLRNRAPKSELSSKLLMIARLHHWEIEGACDTDTGVCGKVITDIDPDDNRKPSFMLSLAAVAAGAATAAILGRKKDKK